MQSADESDRLARLFDRIAAKQHEFVGRAAQAFDNSELSAVAEAFATTFDERREATRRSYLAYLFSLLDEVAEHRADGRTWEVLDRLDDALAEVFVAFQFGPIQIQLSDGSPQIDPFLCVAAADKLGAAVRDFDDLQEKVAGGREGGRPRKDRRAAIDCALALIEKKHSQANAARIAHRKFPDAAASSEALRKCISAAIKQRQSDANVRN